MMSYLHSNIWLNESITNASEFFTYMTESSSSTDNYDTSINYVSDDTNVNDVDDHTAVNDVAQAQTYNICDALLTHSSSDLHSNMSHYVYDMGNTILISHTNTVYIDTLMTDIRTD